MKKIGVFACLMVMAFMTSVGIYLTMHAGEVSATSVTKQAVPLLKNRYGITATPEELNKMDGVTATTAELNYVDGVTSAIQTQLDAKTGTSLADAKAYVGNAGTALAQNISLINDVTGTMINTGVINATIPASTITSSMIAIANVQASNLFTNTVSLVIAAGTTTNSVAVESGSVLLSVFPRLGVSNDYTITNAVYSGGNFTVDTDAHPADMTVDGLFIRP